MWISYKLNTLYEINVAKHSFNSLCRGNCQKEPCSGNKSSKQYQDFLIRYQGVTGLYKKNYHKVFGQACKWYLIPTNINQSPILVGGAYTAFGKEVEASLPSAL